MPFWHEVESLVLFIFVLEFDSVLAFTILDFKAMDFKAQAVSNPVSSWAGHECGEVDHQGICPSLDNQHM